MASVTPQLPGSVILPTLASDLLAERHVRHEKHASAGRDTLLKTECAEIDDEVLCGGWTRGQIVGLSGEMSVGRLIALHLVASALMQSLERVTVVDTGGSFPVRTLAAVLRSRMEMRDGATGMARSGRVGERDEGVDAEVRRCLERVDICRALDFIGVVEIVGDVGRTSEDAETRRDKTAAGTEGMREEIGDSEEEAESVEDLEDIPQATEQKGSGAQDGGSGTSVIVIDNITSVVGNLFNSSELTSSHKLLQAFATNLLSITRRHNILCLILNSTLSTSPSNQQARQTSEYVSYGNQSLSPSIFTSNGHLRPSLGALFSNIPELHFLLSRLPKFRQDAELLYGRGEPEEQSTRNVLGVHYSYVLEVIKDESGILVVDPNDTRWENREQRWGAFDIEDDVRLKDAIVKNESMEAMGQLKSHSTIEKGMREGVSVIAKEYGFGRNPRGL